MDGISYTLIPSSEISERVDSVLKGIAEELDKLRLPGLVCVALGGGYGRGEGGVLRTPQGDRLYNDLDFFVFSDGAGAGERRGIDAETARMASERSGELGIDVDFCRVRNVAELRRVAGTLMYQELLRGWRPVWGRGNLRDWIPEREASELPFSEAARLLLNRGMGLLFAGEYLKNGRNDPDFIVRNMNKAYLGGGDALLIASGKYCWRGPERVDAYRELVRTQKLSDEFSARYEKAFRWKLEPEVKLPDDPADAWRRCRKFYLDSVALCSGREPGAAVADIIAGLRRRAGGERSLKNGLRWLIRGHALRSPLAAFDPPVVTVLEMVCSLLSAHDGYADLTDRLRTLWGVFN